ncbi:MAG: 2-amino-4-hydroxy-6-hydroxymethyldihydropteridine diphosphokinase [Comamonadaceae bacterium]
MLRASVTAYLALGANLGDPVAALLTAMDEIAAIKGVSLLRRSSLYRTAPLAASGPDFVNAVVEIQTILSAPQLLVALQQIEQLAGRVRTSRNAPRTLDLDLLTYGDASIDSQALVVPHPRLGQRAFVLVPLAEIAPHRVTSSQLAAVEQQAIERL